MGKRILSGECFREFCLFRREFRKKVSNNTVAQVVHSSPCLVLVNVSETTKLRLDEGPFVVNVVLVGGLIVEIRLSVKSERFHGGGADWTLDTPT